MTDLHEVFVDHFKAKPQHDLDAMRRTHWELTAKGRQAVRSDRVSGEVPAGAVTSPLPKNN